MIGATLVFLVILQSGGEPPVPEVAPPSAQATDPQQELVERIRKSLRRIDEALLETVDGDDDQVGGSLADVRSRHQDVIRDLEELIKLARYRQSKSSSSSSSSSSGEGSSGAPQQQPRESDGSQSPDPRDGGSDPSDPGGSEQRPDEQQPDEQPAGSRPEDGAGAEQDAGENRAGATVPPDRIEPFTREDTDGRWGLLPPKLQERLTNLHVDDVPERYRTWLEAYIRTMHQLEQQPRER